MEKHHEILLRAESTTCRFAFCSLNFKVMIVFLLLFSLFFSACATGEGDGDGEGNSNSSHNAGLNCLASGCHLSGEKIFTVAGTVYQSDMVTPRAGAIIIINKGTYSRSLTTDASGNFYAYDANLASGTMSSAYVQDTGVPMNSPTTFPSGCNSCHGVSTNRIY